ncbi:multicopper oxidase [Ancylobacter aquaticus]|uniref:Multicopper oxidase n=1 Tax=Ancylobacter aquaticus TaxID=100 RepID=A0A4R1I790_ANCAQ|nr:multicopper oxidase [Ancylobacter aquaticus]
MGNLVRVVAPAMVSAFFLWLPGAGATFAQPATYQPPEYREPVVLSGVDGVLEVTLTAHQGEARLDTSAVPVKNTLLYGYELVRGKASNGVSANLNNYPAPTLQVFPGEKLIIHYQNGLAGLSIRDFYDPLYTREGEEVPIYPPQLTVSPLNLHTHGLHVSPKANSDNVLLHMPPGTVNTYVYDVPRNMPHGMYWYHPHLHTLTSPHVYLGLAGLLAIGRPDGNLPVVTQKSIPVRSMALQYNFVFDRTGAEPGFGNPNWPQFVSTRAVPKEGELAAGTYRPILAPVDFAASPKGSRFATVWYAGPLSIHNMRGRFQFIPNNLQRFTASAGPEGNVPANPALPDHLRDIQFTVNGQFQPVLRGKPGQTEIWVLANISEMAYMTVRLTETATGRHPKIAIVGQDGNPSPAVRTPVEGDGTRLVIPPASRFAIAVTLPTEGELVLDMPARGGGARTENAPGILYTSNGTENPPAVLGALSVEPAAVSYYDGFFFFPTQKLMSAVVEGEKGESTPFPEGQSLGAFTSFDDLSKVTPDVTRNILINGGFLNNLASKADPKAFIYAFDSGAFPNVPLMQPRLDSVEEWVFRNENNDEHPIHVHVNDFQIISVSDPTIGLKVGAVQQGIDNANVPAPNLGPEESVIEAGELTIRTRFEDYAGLFVMHCHRLNHEDNGLMALVNVIPAISSYAVAVPGAPGRAATVRVMDGDRLLATVTPFPGYEGTPSVAIGDVDDDGIYDLVVGAGPGHAPEVAVFSGAARQGGGVFATELARFLAFDAAATGGVSVAAAQVDGLGTGDNVIAGSGPGVSSEIRVFVSKLPAVGTAPELFATFNPFYGERNGVTLATGFVDFTTGRQSIVAAPGAGSPATVKVFVFPGLRAMEGEIGSHAHRSKGPPRPVLSASFTPFGPDYRGGVSLATGWLAGVLGGAERIVIGQQDGAEVAVYSAGSALDGGPPMYLQSAAAHQKADFTEMARFTPFGAQARGVSVATSSTTTGADLLVATVPGGGAATVRRFAMERAGEGATTLAASPLGEARVESAGAVVLGGD